MEGDLVGSTIQSLDAAVETNNATAETIRRQDECCRKNLSLLVWSQERRLGHFLEAVNTLAFCFFRRLIFQSKAKKTRQASLVASETNAWL